MATQSVGRELTDAFNFISTAYDKAKELHELSEKLFTTLDSAEPTGSQEFHGKNLGNTYDAKEVKKPTEKYKEKVHQELHYLEVDYKLFVIDMKAIYAQREDSEVMHRYTDFERWYEKYKDLIKKRKKKDFTNDVKKKALYYKNHEAFVLFTYISNIVRAEDSIDSLLKAVFNKLKTFVHGEKGDEKD